MSQAGADGGPGRSIGAVVAELVAEFPDLTISKLRFLETEGLVTPLRLPSGYRRYRDADVERLRYVLTAQRDRFWPLKVIRDALDALDRGLTPAGDWPVQPDGDGGGTGGLGRVAGTPGRPVVPAVAADPGLPRADDLAPGPALRLTDAELCDASGLTPEALTALAGYGLLRAGRDGHWDGPALAVATAAAQLAAVGIEPRHLRPFRTAADREVALVRQAVRPGDEAEVRRVLQQCLALHVALVRAGTAAPPAP
ncbi:MerR family transcriptional regulator [Lapillicoccus jejuensis]|uniref:MerR-like DNA binding protein n=1 Tax=Lapillicoccus jejuensis TaxID=402171 RepID=A0A542E514_9MICO|nr:MerR family transcriptional regulator [Lapillicoccus jejuensis]TQJ10430.1 MerR-like DNA binding protein [Lapillicoccus jejuensis]